MAHTHTERAKEGRGKFHDPFHSYFNLSEAAIEGWGGSWGGSSKEVNEPLPVETRS